jgi:hypothetical protein
MHELHWGSSEDRLSEAIAGCVAAVLVLPKKDAGRSVERGSGDPCDGRWTTDKRGDGPALGIHFAAAASPSKQVMTASKTVQLSDSNGG